MIEVRSQNEEMSDVKNSGKGGRKGGGKGGKGIGNAVRTLVRPMWRAAAAGLKPLRLPRAQLPFVLLMRFSL